MCKKQTAVSHYSTESQIISLDTGLKLDGLPALELWDLIVSVLGNVSRVSDRSGKLESDDLKHHKSHKKIDVMKDIDAVPSNVQSASQEVLLYVFEDNEAVIKKIIKGKKPYNETCFQNPQSCAWFVIRPNQFGLKKIQIKYIDTKNQLADILTKGNFKRHEWNHLLCSFNITHFISTTCSEAMSRRTQKRCRWRKSHSKIEADDKFSLATKGFLTFLLLLHRKARGRYESQILLSSWTEQQSRTGRPVEDAYSSSYSEWNIDKTWSSQECKSDEVLEVRKIRLVNEQPSGLFTQHTDRFIVDNDDMDSDTVAESDMSLMSRSFLHRVNDWMRKMLDQSSTNATQDSNKHSLICRMFMNWGMFMTSTMEASIFIGKEYTENWLSI